MQNYSNGLIHQSGYGFFRNPEESEDNNIIDLGSRFDSPDSEESDLFPFPDVLEPLLPPQINYDKVAQIAAKKFKNDTLILRKFYFNPTFNNILLLAALLLFILWIIVSNVVTIMALWRARRPGHVAEIYLANLAVSDVLLGVLILPLMSVVILIGYFPFKPYVCDAWVFLDYYLIVASSFGNTALMFNYFWMIRCPGTFPVDFKPHFVALVVIWMSVNLSWTPPFFNDRLSVIYPTGQCGFSISKNQYFSFYIGVTGLYLPLLISLICGIGSVAILRRKSGLSLFFWRKSWSHQTSGEELFDRKTSWKSSAFHLNPSSYTLESHKNKYTTTDGRLAPSAVGRLSQFVRNSFSNSVSEADEISRVAAEHFPTVAAYLVLSIVCRGMFFVYFGVGSFVHNFFPPDLSNGVYWLMHSEAALSPIVHFVFDSELRKGILKILGIRNARNSPLVQPIVNIIDNVNHINSSSSSSSKDKATLPVPLQLPLPSTSAVRDKPRSLQHFMSFDHDNGHRQQLVGVHRSPEDGLHL